MLRLYDNSQTQVIINLLLIGDRDACQVARGVRGIR
jgi:hypothetical protein